jgi:hypothetical protein
MTVQAELSNREQLLATAAELQAMADLIGKYPAEAQLIIATLCSSSRWPILGKSDPRRTDRSRDL